LGVARLDRLTVGGDVIGINRSASNAVAALDVPNRQMIVFGDKILDLENGFRKLGSVACEFGAT